METWHKLSWISRKKVANKHLKKAYQEIFRAKQLLQVQFEAIGDPKLFLLVIDALHTGIVECMIAKLARKKIGIRSSNSLEILKLYQMYCGHGPEGNALVWLTALKMAHKNSPLCFRKKEVYVICNDSLEMATITEEKLMIHMEVAQELVKNINGNDRRRG
jgi:hypothetical protein